MQKHLLALVVLPMFLVRSAPVPITEMNIPASAQATILRDYLEWTHLPKYAGDCANLPIVRVTWVEPEAVFGARPVVWIREPQSGRFGAILELSDSQIRSLGETVRAEPVLVLRDVSVYRLCRARKSSPE